MMDRKYHEKLFRSIPITALFLISGIAVFAQSSIRIGLYPAVTLIGGDITRYQDTLTTHRNANTGFDIHLTGERYFENRFSLILRMGISLYPVNEDKLKNTVVPCNPEAVMTEKSPYQNFSFLVGGGYTFLLFQDKLEIQPYVYGGLGIFRSSWFVLEEGNKQAVYKGDVGLNINAVPGLKVAVPLGNFFELSLFTEYVFGRYNTTENLQISDNGKDTTNEMNVTYRLQSWNAGLGFAVRF